MATNIHPPMQDADDCHRSSIVFINDEMRAGDQRKITGLDAIYRTTASCSGYQRVTMIANGENITFRLFAAPHFLGVVVDLIDIERCLGEKINLFLNGYAAFAFFR